MRVVGTAGHVDHGKSTLVQALTGINPDRLREEQERHMTIDLGFAWLELPNGESVGIVDVPGHRDFIENMLAGVGSIDAALFVIAADEGVMQQTREHLAILDLLQIERGVVALSKIDLIKDEEWLELVNEDVSRLLQETVLANAPIVPVSANRGTGLENLIESLQNVLEEAPARRDTGQPRLSIDRAFSISGFGTVVTGTLVDGTLGVGDEIEILPQGLKGRIRGLQTHKEKIEEAVPGSRVAVNISGVEVDDVQRGDVVLLPGTAESTRRIDVQFELLGSSDLPIRHNQEVKLFIGAAQRIARIRLLGSDELIPGQEGWLQLELDSPIVAARGDRYILRRPSPPATIGGGQVVDAHPERRHRRWDKNVIERLEHYLIGEPRDVLIQTLQRLGPLDWNGLSEAAGMDLEELRHARDQAVGAGEILQLGGSSEADVIYIGGKTWHQLTERITAVLENYHRENRLRAGMSVEELRSRLKLDPGYSNPLLARAAGDGLIDVDGQVVRIAGFTPELSSDQSERVDKLIKRFERDPYAPPSVKESIQAVGEEVYRYLVSSDTLVPVTEDVVFHRAGYDQILKATKQYIEENDAVTIAELRDHFKTSRKYVLAFMEHLDAIGVTEREGDHRRLVVPKI
jgi:selenocysteine-specific elongation factor